MGTASRATGPRPNIAVATLATVLAGCWTITPAVAAVPDLICGQVARASDVRYASAEALQRAAREAEAQTATASGAEALQNALAALEVTLDSPIPADGDAVAEYCTAAGEVMRRAPEGSQYQAQTYLLNGYRLASQEGIQDVASRAAFRLGLVSSSGSAVAGARGGARSSQRRNAAVASELAEIMATPSGAYPSCAALEVSNLFEKSNGFIAEVALQCAAKRALDATDPQLSALASLRLARLRLGLAEAALGTRVEIRAAALSDVLAALPVASAISNEAMRAELTGRLLNTALDLGAPAVEAMRQGLASMRATTTDDPGLKAFADAIEARLALLVNDRPRARALLGHAILGESQRPLPARLPEYYLLMASVEPERREQHAYAAYTVLNNIRPLLPRTDPLTEESTFSLYMRRVFESAVDAELGSSATATESLRIGRAQEIIEAYRQAELQSVFGSECLPVRNALQPRQLRSDEVLLYPILLPDRIELLYVSGGDSAGEVRYRRLPANRTANRTTVARLVEDVVLSIGYGNDNSWRGPARQLYDLLIAPIEAELRPGAMLAIVPDGALRGLPFAALLAADGQYLIQKTRISVAPALAYSQPGEQKRDKAPAIVAASLQQELNLPAGYFPRLEGTAEEARIAAGSSRGGLFIADFRKQDLVQALSAKPVDVLHLATHASFNGRSDRAFVVANGEIIPLSELRGLIARNRARGDELTLLVLSACETAVGDDEASMGLAGAAVQAGALSAIASLWQVNDLGTAELMKQFYSRYSAGKSRSESLREAQMTLLAGGGENADPNIWAAFTLLGAWR